MAALGVIRLLEAAMKPYQSWAEVRRQRNRVRKYLGNLTEHEAAILRQYIGPQTRSTFQSPMDGVVQGLVHAGVLYRAANLGQVHKGFAFNLTEAAWEYLEEQQWFRQTDDGGSD